MTEDAIQPPVTIASGIGASMVDSLDHVVWDAPPETADPGAIVLTGTAFVATPLTANFRYFVLGGFLFQLTSEGEGATSVHFSYFGREEEAVIEELFITGAQLVFG